MALRAEIKLGISNSDAQDLKDSLTKIYEASELEAVRDLTNVVADLVGLLTKNSWDD